MEDADPGSGTSPEGRADSRAGGMGRPRDPHASTGLALGLEAVDGAGGLTVPAAAIRLRARSMERMTDSPRRRDLCSPGFRNAIATLVVVAVLGGCTEYEDDPTREEPASQSAGTPAYSDPTPGSTSARTTRQAYDRLEQRINDYQQKVIEEADK